MLDSAVDEMAADEKGLRLLVGGCWYRLSDGEARVRAYVKGSTVRRFWAGYYNAKAIDHYTGGVLASYVSAANVQEYHAYPTLYEQLVENLGQPLPRRLLLRPCSTTSPASRRWSWPRVSTLTS